jgi:hypothetical protein
MEVTVKAQIFETERISINRKKTGKWSLLTHLVGLFERVHSSILGSIFWLKTFQSVFSFQFNSQNCEICFTSPFTLHYPYILHFKANIQVQ